MFFAKIVDSRVEFVLRLMRNFDLAFKRRGTMNMKVPNRGEVNEVNSRVQYCDAVTAKKTLAHQPKLNSLCLSHKFNYHNPRYDSEKKSIAPEKWWKLGKKLKIIEKPKLYEKNFEVLSGIECVRVSQIVIYNERFFLFIRHVHIS